MGLGEGALVKGHLHVNKDDLQERLDLLVQTPCVALSSVMLPFAKRPFIAPMGHKCLHQSLRSNIAENMTAPAVMMISSQPESAAELGRSQTSSQMSMPANKASMNQPPQASTAVRVC